MEINNPSMHKMVSGFDGIDASFIGSLREAEQSAYDTRNRRHKTLDTARKSSWIGWIR